MDETILETGDGVRERVQRLTSPLWVSSGVHRKLVRLRGCAFLSEMLLRMHVGRYIISHCCSNFDDKF